MKYYDKPDARSDKAAFSLTVDAGCEYGGGVSCSGGTAAAPSQYFLGFMAYNRFWFDHDRYALTVGGGAINNPGRYLVLMPPINGATAFSGTPYFTDEPRRHVQGVGHAGRRSTTCPTSSSRSAPSSTTATPTCRTSPARAASRLRAATQGAPGSLVAGWTPDLRKTENRINCACS